MIRIFWEICHNFGPLISRNLNSRHNGDEIGNWPSDQFVRCKQKIDKLSFDLLLKILVEAQPRVFISILQNYELSEEINRKITYGLIKLMIKLQHAYLILDCCFSLMTSIKAVLKNSWELVFFALTSFCSAAARFWLLDGKKASLANLVNWLILTFQNSEFLLANLVLTKYTTVFKISKHLMALIAKLIWR